MAKNNVDNGRAFEYAFIENLNLEISKSRTSSIINNSSYYTSKCSFESLDNNISDNLVKASKAAIPTILELEPMILKDDKEDLHLRIQSDEQGEIGDVRDIVVDKSSIGWEVGLSMKHNHFAVKHSRLSSKIDFAEKWFGKKCSDIYWKEVRPIFSNLEKLKEKNMKWSDLENKEDDVYVPLLKSFLKELSFQYEADSSIPGKLVEYLLGKYDFYKVVGVDSNERTEIQVFNIHGTLNKQASKSSKSIRIGVAKLPTRIINIGFKPSSKNTIELYLDNGWQFTFRIHNAATKVESSLKFDIQIVGAPTTIETINCRWR